jgi:uncharacterized protein
MHDFYPLLVGRESVEGHHRIGHHRIGQRRIGDMPTRVHTVNELRELYREPSQLVQGKIKAAIDPVSQRFIERSPFVMIATLGGDGRVDVSPRGGPAGFIRVRTDGTIAIPDLNGNNLIDTLRAVVESGRAGLLVIHPGKEETLRVNGTAFITTDPEVLGEFTSELRPPKSAIVVEPEEVFIHCAKAFRRGGVWNSDSWALLGDAPDAVDILSCQLELSAETSARLRGSLQSSYTADLEAD